MIEGLGRARTILLSVIISAVLLPTSYATTTWDLAANWSNTDNPGTSVLGSAWSYRTVSGGLFSLFQNNTSSTLWGPINLSSSFTLSRWTDPSNPNGMAGLSMSNGNDIVVFPTGEVGGAAYDIRWTAPFSTVITVTADVWMMRSGGANLQSWDVKLTDGATVTDPGAVNIPANSRVDNSLAVPPQTLVDAFGASYLQNIAVNAGATLDLIVDRANIDQSLDFVGVDFRITAAGNFPAEGSPGIPEPGTVGLFAGGLALIGVGLRRKRA